MYNTSRLSYDAIIVLAGGIQDSGELPNNVKNRLKRAKQLYDLGLATQIIMSGKWSVYRQTHLPPRTEAEAMREYALGLQIPDSCIHKEEQSYDTKGNAFCTKTLFLEPNNWKRVLVVTSDFHLPRAKHLFETELGPAYTAKFVGAKTDFHPLKWFIRLMREKVVWPLQTHQEKFRAARRGRSDRNDAEQEEVSE